jgi:hypothetical protein
MGAVRNLYKILIRKPERQRLLGRQRRRWEDNIRVDLGHIGWESVDCMHVVFNRDQWRALVNTIVNLRVP